MDTFRKTGSAPKLMRILLPDISDPAVIRAALKQAFHDGDLEMYREFLQIQKENLRLRWEAKRLQAARRELEQ